MFCSDILSGIETRLSLLSMTYTKYIETGAACFIPGKVLDEVVRILCLVQGSAKATLEGNTSNLPRAHELLQVGCDDMPFLSATSCKQISISFLQ